MTEWKVFERGSGKWVKVVDGDVLYVSDQGQSERFDDRGLVSAHNYFGDFSIYKDTLHAVPMGGNEYPWNYTTVSKAVREITEQKGE